MSDFCAYWREATELSHEKIRSRTVDRAAAPEDEKEYPDAPRIALPSPSGLPTGGADLWKALHQRRSVRRYSPMPLPLPHAAALLWACQGVTARQGPYRLKTAPSAGALYPLETYLFAHRVEGLAPGLYHFRPSGFLLEDLRREELAAPLVSACLGQRFLAEAPAVFAWTALPGRCAWKYGDRAARYIGLDIGHAAQNLLLAASSLGLGSCAVGAFLDEPLNDLLGVDGQAEYAFYLACAGFPRAGD